MLSNRANSLKPICQIDVAALASVMVVLVFVIMVWETFAYSPHHGVAIDLPKVGHSIEMPQAKREDASMVSIMRDGKIFFRNERVTVAELPPKIDGLLSHGGEKKVYIQADARVGYGTVKPVLDAVRSAGVESIGILVAQ
jgi:biopolymer transport protein TolR